MNSSGVELDEEQDIQPSKQNRVDAEEVAGQQALGLGSAELGPRGLGASRTGLDVVTAEDLPDARRRQDHSHTGELPVDPPIAPGRVLAGQGKHDAHRPRGDPGSAAASVRVGPVTAYQVTVPAKQGLRSDEEPSPAALRKEACQSGQQGLGQVVGVPGG